jgi:hypothetical protein
MFRILDLKLGEYVRSRFSWNGRTVGDIVLWPTYEEAEAILDNMPILYKYQGRIKEQFVIEEVPNE